MSALCVQAVQADVAGQAADLADANLECRLAGPGSPSASWGPCTRTAAYSGLRDGKYAFEARVRGSAAAEASSNFTVDTAAPAVQARPATLSL